MIARWFGILAELDFDILFRPGAQSVVADALGRRPADRVDVATQTDDPTVRGVSALPWSSSYLKEQRDLDAGPAPQILDWRGSLSRKRALGGRGPFLSEPTVML